MVAMAGAPTRIATGANTRIVTTVMTMSRQQADYDTDTDDTQPTPGPWDWTPQLDTTKVCYRAQVWDPDGDSLAVLESKPDSLEADANARLIAAAGTAASKLPEGTDPLSVMELLPDIYAVADWTVGSTKFRDEDGKAHPPDREFMVQLRDLLNDTLEE
jgi:hypothetical protein